jgi:hypothetical protein
MPVPETTVDKDYLSTAWKDKIGSTWQLAAMKPVAIAQGMREPTNLYFRAGISRADPTHPL